MEKLITINLSYYNQSKNILSKHIEYWNSYPTKIKKLFTFFIIDDCSQIPAEELLKDMNLSSLDIHLYRVEKDLICNIAGVRNLGAKECKTPWYIILDMDTLISPTIAEQLTQLASDNMKNNKAFLFNRKVINDPKHIKNNVPHPAVCLIRIKDYWNVGGCEEDLVGSYGKTDGSFWYKASGKVEQVTKNDIYLEYYPEGESNIQRDVTRNQKIFSQKKKNNSWSTDYVRFPWKKVF